MGRQSDDVERDPRRTVDVRVGKMKERNLSKLTPRSGAARRYSRRLSQWVSECRRRARGDGDRRRRSGSTSSTPTTRGVARTVRWWRAQKLRTATYSWCSIERQTVSTPAQRDEGRLSSYYDVAVGGGSEPAEYERGPGANREEIGLSSCAATILKSSRRRRNRVQGRVYSCSYDGSLTCRRKRSSTASGWISTSLRAH